MWRVVIASAVVLAIAGSALPAAADADHKVTSGGNEAVVKAWQKKSAPDRTTPKKRPYSNLDGPSAGERKVRAWENRLAAYKQYQTDLAGWQRCQAAGCPVAAPKVVPPPGEPPVYIDSVAGAGPAAPAITPEQAAWVAIARLQLTPLEAGIGPSPDINEWHIAAVGYPYWLWADGNLDPAPVTTTVGPLTVSLDAHLEKTTFDLGDGTKITCTDLTQKWTPAVEPGAVSPACGHTYTEPSLPRGKYTITAYSTWAVDWAVNGVGGTIPLYQQSSTTLPVGELQVLTR